MVRQQRLRRRLREPARHEFGDEGVAEAELIRCEDERVAARHGDHVGAVFGEDPVGTRGAFGRGDRVCPAAGEHDVETLIGQHDRIVALAREGQGWHGGDTGEIDRVVAFARRNDDGVGGFGDFVLNRNAAVLIFDVDRRVRAADADHLIAVLRRARQAFGNPRADIQNGGAARRAEVGGEGRIDLEAAEAEIDVDVDQVESRLEDRERTDAAERRGDFRRLKLAANLRLQAEAGVADEDRLKEFYEAGRPGRLIQHSLKFGQAQLAVVIRVVEAELEEDIEGATREGGDQHKIQIEGKLGPEAEIDQPAGGAVEEEAVQETFRIERVDEVDDAAKVVADFEPDEGLAEDAGGEDVRDGVFDLAGQRHAVEDRIDDVDVEFGDVHQREIRGDDVHFVELAEDQVQRVAGVRDQRHVDDEATGGATELIRDAGGRAAFVPFEIVEAEGAAAALAAGQIVGRGTEIEIAEDEEPAGFVQRVGQIVESVDDVDDVRRQPDHREGGARRVKRDIQREHVEEIGDIRERIGEGFDRVDHRRDEAVIKRACIEAQLIERHAFDLQPVGQIEVDIDQQLGDDARNDVHAAKLNRIARRGIDHLADKLEVQIGLRLQRKLGKLGQGKLTRPDDIFELDLNLVRRSLALGQRDAGKVAGFFVARFAEEIDAKPDGKADRTAFARVVVRDHAETVRIQFIRVDGEGGGAEKSGDLERALEIARVHDEIDGNLVLVSIVQQEEPALIEAKADIGVIGRGEIDLGPVFDLQLEARDAEIEAEIEGFAENLAREGERAVKEAVLRRAARIEEGLEISLPIRSEKIVELIVHNAGQKVHRRRQIAVLIRGGGEGERRFDDVETQILEDRHARGEIIADDRQIEIAEEIIHLIVQRLQDQINALKQRLGVV